VKANTQASAEVGDSLDCFHKLSEEQPPQHLCSRYSLGSFYIYVVFRLRTCITTVYSMMMKCNDPVLHNVEHSLPSTVFNVVS
jgi:hypothetical protein